MGRKPPGRNAVTERNTFDTERRHGRPRPFRRLFPTGPVREGVYSLAACDQRLTESTSTKNCRKTLPLRTEKGRLQFGAGPSLQERISVYGAKTGLLAPVGAASCSQNWVPSARVAMWYPDRQLMSVEERAPGRSVPGAVGADSPHAASASVAVTASRTRIRIAAPSIDPNPQTQDGSRGHLRSVHGALNAKAVPVDLSLSVRSVTRT